uniref:Uncharacterized protein n=1 Tax=Caenorhabditis japonica TaxID=281687 RepID=A0A8R1EJG9_CAEJA
MEYIAPRGGWSKTCRQMRMHQSPSGVVCGWNEDNLINLR